ncbi:MAG: Xaa-Pro peptidase family protein [Rhodobacteraceae bacterium]|nr:Xaa-Pro peptidase family protein [Paracoccaceae bacterium]
MLHFSDEEFAARTGQLEQAMERSSLDGMLLFAPESQYWLTGYDTFGFCFFQCLVVGGPRPVLLTRSADLLQARLTSNIEDVRIWMDDDAARPENDLAELIQELGLSGKRLGIETDTCGLTGYNCLRVHERLDGVATLVEASDVVPEMRLTKSEAELAYVRKAGELADNALDAAVEASAPGVDEGRVLARMQGAVFEGGGDYPGNEFIIGSAEHAMLVRYASGTRALDEQDQLNLEWAGVYRHYHVAMMRTLIIGEPCRQHLRMHEVGVEALLRCESELRPGNSMERVFDEHVQALEDNGMGHFRLNACGYSLGARFTPTWMDRFMFRAGAKTIIQPGMVFFLHMILLDGENSLAMCTGRTSLVTEGVAKPLSRHNLSLITI